MRYLRCWWLGTLLIGCAGAGGGQAASAETTSAGGTVDDPQALKKAFDAGQFQQVVAECPDLQDQSASFDTRSWCSALVPASLHALGKHDAALARVAESCKMMAPAGPKSDARASQLTMIMLVLTEAHGAGHFEATSDERNALLQGWLEACQVPLEQVEATIIKSQEEAP